MKITVLLLCLLVIFLANGQERGVYLIKKSNKQTTFLSENKRVCLKTTDGKRLLGRIQVLDDKTIMIDKRVVMIDSIKMIRYRPLVVSILSTTIKAASATVAGLGVAFIVSNNKSTDNTHGEHGNAYNFVGPILIGVSAFYYGIGALLHVPFNKHNHKRWTYKINSLQDSVAVQPIKTNTNE